MSDSQEKKALKAIATIFNNWNEGYINAFEAMEKIKIELMMANRSEAEEGDQS